MNIALNTGCEIRKLRCYASLFSRSVIGGIMQYGDFRAVDEICSYYEKNKFQKKTYLNYFNYVYRKMANEYRCEYVYKNELINKHLLVRYGTRHTVYFNEYRVGENIADLATFNSVSRAFEIKTELDNTKRLKSQLETYSHLFQYVYVVIPVTHLEDVRKAVPEGTGIIVLSNCGKLTIYEERKAVENSDFDPLLFMQCLRIEECKNMIREYYGMIPDVSCFDMFDECKKLIVDIPLTVLRDLFIKQMKKRKTATSLLRKMPISLRQATLGMNMNKHECELLIERLRTEK